MAQLTRAERRALLRVDSFLSNPSLEAYLIAQRFSSADRDMVAN